MEIEASAPHNSSKKTREKKVSLDERVFNTLPRNRPPRVQNNAGDTIPYESKQSLERDSSLPRTKLGRSTSFDPALLQRPPSHLSITESLISHKKTLERSVKQNQIPEEPDTSEEAIETDVADVHISVHEKDPEDISEIGACIECAKAVPVFSLEVIEVGDHIIFVRALYDHHGIVVDKPKDGKTVRIVEATNTFSGAVVGFSTGRKAVLAATDQTLDFSKQKIWVVYYRNRIYSKQTVAERAIKFKEEEYEYDLMDNNCEHFATYCVTDKKFSIQVTKFRLTLRLFLTSGLKGISNEVTRNEKEHENKIICKRCFEMNKSLLNVTVDPIKRSSDVKEGDVIRYSYWNLWHDAVVLEVKDEHRNYVTCKIAHYAFCGVFSYRTIKEEGLKISFDGKFAKLVYEPPMYHVYDPETVVERAKKRLGEQHFVFFSNDSSHYSRWCKLKLEKPVEERDDEAAKDH